jgi:hypothetical protein
MSGLFITLTMCVSVMIGIMFVGNLINKNLSTPWYTDLYVGVFAVSPFLFGYWVGGFFL